MDIADEVVKIVGHAIRNVHAGNGKLVSRKLADRAMRGIVVTSPAFTHETRLPVSCTVDGAGTPPALEWHNVPVNTRSIVVVCEDADTRLPEPFVHWIVYGIRASARSLDARTSEACQHGRTGSLKAGFAPFAPRPGHGVHHYHFQVFALDTDMGIDGLGRGALVDHMRGHVLSWGEIVGTYERS